MKYVDIILRTLHSMCYFDMKKVRYLFVQIIQSGGSMVLYAK